MRRSKRTPEYLEAWAKRYREAVEPHLGEEDLEAVGAFERISDGETVVGLIGWISEQSGGKGRVGKLPSSFLLAVTRDKVHAFDYRQRGSNLVIRKQLASFDRDGITFYPEEGYGSGWLDLQVTEGGRSDAIALEGRTLQPGEADVLAALRR